MKKITLTFNIDDEMIIGESDNIETIKDKMLSNMFDYLSYMSFWTFCDICDIEIKEEEE